MSTIQKQPEVFYTFCRELEQYNIVEVAELAGIAASTLYKWIDGTTVGPRIVALERVAEVIGLTVEIEIKITGY